MNVHFLRPQDWAWDELDQVLAARQQAERHPAAAAVEGKSITLAIPAHPNIV